MRGFSRFGSLLATLCMLGVAQQAGAQISNSNDPIEITAEDSAEYFRSEGRIVYSKNVRAVQGNSQITADSLTVVCLRRPRADGGESCSDIARIVAQGKVQYRTPNETISGDRIEYDAESEVLTVTGDVILSRTDEGVAQGTKVIYNVREGRATITSENRPVVGIFNTPKRDNAQPTGN